LGMDVPELIITNADLEAVVETTDEWIRTRTGIHERRFANDRETVTTLGFEAARKALDRADMLPSEIDLIIVATSTPENFYPSTAARIQNMIGATHAGAFDLSAACAGFVYAVNMAVQAIRSGSIDKALVIGSETNSRIMDWDDRATCVLFGDGAGAIVLCGSDEPGGVLSCVLGSDGSGEDLLGVPTVGQSSMPEGRQMHKVHMNGREVFRFAPSGEPAHSGGSGAQHEYPRIDVFQQLASLRQHVCRVDPDRAVRGGKRRAHQAER